MLKNSKYIFFECAKNVKMSTMELGGHDPFIVLKDADLELAVNCAYISRTMNSG